MTRARCRGMMMGIAEGGHRENGQATRDDRGSRHATLD